MDREIHFASQVLHDNKSVVAPTLTTGIMVG